MVPRPAACSPVALALRLARGGALVGGVLGCDPFGTEFAPIEPAQVYQASETSEPSGPEQELRVMTYNIKFGGGRIDFFFDCHGDRVLMTKAEVLDHLEALGEKIRDFNPDVLFLQEVDVNSKRAAFVDQVQWLLDHTALNHGVYASQWRADFVPSDGLGAVDSGNAILAKWPLENGTRIALPLREDQSGVERYFYLRRNLLRAELVTETGTQLTLIGVHTAAFSQDGTKKKHIDRFRKEMDLAAENGLVLGAGDLNTLPPDSTQQHDFDDSACTNEFEADDYRAERNWLEPLYDVYEAAIPLAAYHADNASFFTHTTSKDGFWNRKLDYLFTNGSFVPGSGLVHQSATQGGWETMPLSDHAPVSAVWEIP